MFAPPRRVARHPLTRRSFHLGLCPCEGIGQHCRDDEIRGGEGKKVKGGKGRKRLASRCTSTTSQAAGAQRCHAPTTLSLSVVHGLQPFIVMATWKAARQRELQKMREPAATCRRVGSTFVLTAGTLGGKAPHVIQIIRRSAARGINHWVCQK